MTENWSGVRQGWVGREGGLREGGAGLGCGRGMAGWGSQSFVICFCTSGPR